MVDEVVHMRLTQFLVLAPSMVIGTPRSPHILPPSTKRKGTLFIEGHGVTMEKLVEVYGLCPKIKGPCPTRRPPSP